MVAVLLWIVTAVFFSYVFFVERRNRKLVVNAAQSNAIVTNMFPGPIRDRVMAEQDVSIKRLPKYRQWSPFQGSILTSRQTTDIESQEETQPLGKFSTDNATSPYTSAMADVFHETSIAFMDLANFTAWSSSRQPSHVFILLEHVYRAFDVQAKKRRVFKVETVGDCYVAAAGVPEFQKNHAVILTRFVRDCLRTLRETTKSLEASLGPDTGELGMRVGIHSGPVTAGVLRGDRSRFQLFGDTMNMASRMESHGIPGRIQVSKDTADLLVDAGKSHWLKPREEIIFVKGKDSQQTFWVSIYDEDDTSHQNSDPWEIAQFQGSIDEEALDVEKQKRLIDWNVRLLEQVLKQIVYVSFCSVI